MDRYNVLLFFFVQESAGRFQRIWKLFWPGSATIVPFRIPGKRSVLFSERRFLFAGTFRSTPALSFRQPFSFGPCVWGHHLFQMTSTLALVPFLAHILLFSSAVLLYVIHVLWLTLYQALERNGAQTALCLFWFPLNCVSFRTGTPFFKISLKWIFSLFLCGCESADHKVLRFWFVHWTHPPFWSNFFVFAASQFLLDPVSLDLFLVCLSSHFTDYFRLLFLEGVCQFLLFTHSPPFSPGIFPCSCSLFSSENKYGFFWILPALRSRLEDVRDLLVFSYLLALL